MSVIVGSTLFLVFGILSLGIGGGTYWMIGRYEDQVKFIADSEVDFTTRQTLFTTLFQLGLTVIQFAILAWLAVQFDLVTNTGLNGARPSTILAAVSTALGTFLGGAIPYLIHQNGFVAQLNNSFAGQVGGQVLTFGSFLGLLVLHPILAYEYTIVYTGSRIVILLVFFWKGEDGNSST